MPRAPKHSQHQSSSSPDFDHDTERSLSKFLQIKRQLSNDKNSNSLQLPQTTESRVGSSFQAEIPEFIARKPSEPPNRENETLWIPDSSEKNIAKLYAALGEEKKCSPCDDEEVLLALFTSGYRIPEAVSVVDETDYANAPTRTISHPRKTFTLEEIRNFEEGILTTGKNFFKIRNKFMPCRAVGDLVEFYYFWKKSRRHDQLIYHSTDCLDVMTTEIMKLRDVRTFMK